MKKRTKILLVGFMVILGLSLLACQQKTPTPHPPTPPEVKLELKTDAKLNYEIDIYDKTFVVINLEDVIQGLTEDIVYEITTAKGSGLTTSNVSKNKFNVFSDSTLGESEVSVLAKYKEENKLTVKLKVKVVDGSPLPTLIRPIEDIAIQAPKFSKINTHVEHTIDLSNYIDASDYITYEMKCEDESVEARIVERKMTLIFTSIGEKIIEIHALKNNESVLSTKFKVNLTYEVPNQIVNGNFNEGWTGWSTDEWSKKVYSIYDSEFDIWGNNIGSKGSYLYGYLNEAGEESEKGTAEFDSSLFLVGGTGYISFMMAGNCTEELQLQLIKYNESGEDEVIETFNNWYYGKYAGSGFIFRSYLYKVDSSLLGSQCYFKVLDNKTSDFGFIMLDEIVTYYEETPNLDDFYQAGYINAPEGDFELDFSDTSKDPFPTDLSSVSSQLYNGDFEKGYAGWYMSTEDKQAYSINDSKVDIWNNPVNGNKHYLYGFANEAATAEFHSSLFKVDGTGLITFKMAGNNTPDLQFVLMKYNPNGEDEVVHIFLNSSYFWDHEESGFIFRQYYYQLDIESLQGSYCYFVVKDYKTNNFGFIMLDDIITYYDINPTIEEGWLEAVVYTAE